METTNLTRRGAMVTGLAMGGAALTGCSRDSRLLRGADAHPDGYPTVQAVQYMAELLRERSGGRLNARVYPGAQLGAERDTLEITIFGGLDFNRVNIAPLGSIVPEALVPTLPFLFRSTAHMRAALDGAPGQKILKAMEPHGLVGMCFYDSGARSFYTRGKLIQTPEDLAGLKIRVMNSDMFVAMVEALGGDATPMTYGEVYQGIMQGVVDGAENNWPSYESSRHFEVAGKYSLTEHVMSPEVFVMSKKRWDKLSEDDHDLIRSCVAESVPFMRELWDARTEAARQTLEDAGIEVVKPDTTAFVEKVQPVWDRFLKTPEMRQLADEIVAMEAPDA